MIVHLDLPSTCIHQASPEGRAQLEKEREWIRQNRRRSTMADVYVEENEDNKEKELRKKKVENKKCLASSVPYIVVQRKFHFWQIRN